MQRQCLRLRDRLGLAARSIAIFSATAFCLSDTDQSLREPQSQERQGSLPRPTSNPTSNVLASSSCEVLDVPHECTPGRRYAKATAAHADSSIPCGAPLYRRIRCNVPHGPTRSSPPSTTRSAWGPRMPSPHPIARSAGTATSAPSTSAGPGRSRGASSTSQVPGRGVTARRCARSRWWCPASCVGPRFRARGSGRTLVG
jgi:hypothetical protein